MKIARRMISGIGIPISQRRSPRPKPIVASYLLGRRRDGSGLVPRKGTDYFMGKIGTKSAERAQVPAQHFAGRGHRQAVGELHLARIFVRRELHLDEFL